jgi:myo-inositol 2-dehydrogenase / D-chiro-inositol 1-dehydrogenase
MGVGVRIGVVGVGRIGAFHARTLLGLDGVASVIVADADGRRAERVAVELGPRARTAESPEAVFAADVDAVVVAASTPAHAPLLRLAASAGVPAFCEKPVALDLEALDDVAGDVASAGILVQVGFQRRFDAGYRAAHDAVATGDLGTLLVVRAATHDPAPPTEAYVAASGGIFRDLHIHDFDAVRYVTGQEIVEVYADGAVRETPWLASHHDVDAAVAVMRLSGGALGILSGTRHDPLGYDVRLEVFSVSDSLAVGYDARSPIRSVEPGAPQPRAAYRDFLDRFEPAYRAELAAFVDAVQAQTESACALAEARAALACALAADRSRAERRPVSIEEVASPSARAATG